MRAIKLEKDLTICKQVLKRIGQWAIMINTLEI